MLTERLAQVEEPRGAKAETVEDAIGRWDGSFTVADLEYACPGVSRDYVRDILKRLRDEGRIECLSRGGAAAPWRKTARWS